MDPQIEHEILTTSPGIPFRATLNHIHHTWARTFHSRPELYLRPHTLAEVQKIVTLARKCRRRLVTVGCSHSPSDLTCTSSWMLNLDYLNRTLHVDERGMRMVVEGGMRLRELNEEAARWGLTMRNLGSIDEQSVSGAIATATHGSSLRHGLLSEDVRALRIVLANGRAVRCSAEENVELFRAALVSLGALGIIVEVEVQLAESCSIEWEQSLEPLSDILARWEGNLWTKKEFTRVWWMPYMKRAIVWAAEKTTKPLRAPEESWYGGSVGFHTYHNLLWLSNYVPALLPWIEWFVFGMQYGFRTGAHTSAVEPQRSGLLMNCLYSQFVNEWALPLSRGPEALTRLSAWLNREGDHGRIPFSAAGLYVHCPIEVRVSDTSLTPTPRPHLDNTALDGPTLYLNATLYRPYMQDPPCRDRYYEAFEWLMRELDGKPHYAKNFAHTSSAQIRAMFGGELEQWARVRDEADPEGMFLGEWHRRTLGLGGRYALGEREVGRIGAVGGGVWWAGELEGRVGGSEKVGSESPGATSSGGESFDMMHGAEVEKSTLFDEVEDEGEEDEERWARFHGKPSHKVTGTAVFDKM